MIEKMKNKLYQYIEKYGLNSILTINESQKLDKELNKFYKENSSIQYFYKQSIEGLLKYFNTYGRLPSSLEWNFYALDNDYLASESIKYISNKSFKHWCIENIKKAKNI